MSIITEGRTDIDLIVTETIHLSCMLLCRTNACVKRLKFYSGSNTQYDIINMINNTQT